MLENSGYFTKNASQIAERRQWNVSGIWLQGSIPRRALSSPDLLMVYYTLCQRYPIVPSGRLLSAVRTDRSASWLELTRSNSHISSFTSQSPQLFSTLSWYCVILLNIERIAKILTIQIFQFDLMWGMMLCPLPIAFPYNFINLILGAYHWQSH